jgi:myo-inositol-1(or 4)-monophosphatase
MVMKTPAPVPALDRDQIDQRLDFACAVADAARILTLKAYANDPVSKNKEQGSHYDPVTETDIAVEKLIRTELEKAFPEDGIIGEEFSDKPGKNLWNWCLDPIDGTRAFVAGVPVWSTLIGISHNDTPQIGVIDHPVLGERYVGAHGKSWKISANDKSRLETRKCAQIDDVILSCTEPMAMFSQGQVAAYEMIRQKARFSRLGLDAYGYALTARGRIDLVLEAQMKPYDIAALIPIIEGAGGKITDWRGRPAHKIDHKGGAVVCAGDPELLEKVYPYLQRDMD